MNLFKISPTLHPLAARIQVEADKITPRTEEAMVEGLHKIITAERAKLGKGPVHMMVVRRIERVASGHVDYSSKIAHYCAELVEGELSYE